MLGGRTVTRYKRDADQYDVIVQTESRGRTTPEDIERMFVRGRGETMVPLSSIVKVREAVSPRELNHFTSGVRSRSPRTWRPATHSARRCLHDQAAARVLPQGYVTGTQRHQPRVPLVVRRARPGVRARAAVHLPRAGGAVRELHRPVRDPDRGAADDGGRPAGFNAAGGTLNVYSQIGLITLVGLISKHGILIVEFSNQLRQQGRSIHDAALDAASQRLRPILMTTGAMVLGALPLALSSGAGAESRQQIGWSSSAACRSARC